MRLVLGLAIAGLAAAQVPEGFDHFYNLEYPEAIACFEKAIAAHPDDAALHNHLAQTIVFQEMFRNGALESELVSGNNSFLRRPKMNPAPATEARFMDETGKAIALAQAMLQKNAKDTKALNDLGIAYGLRSNYNWIVRKAWRDSLRDATAARRYHNRISEIEPDNVDARLVQGLHEYIVGSLPGPYRMLSVLIGLHGDRAKGLHTVEEVARNGRANRIDAEILLCALYRRENRVKMAIPLAKDLIGRFPRNYLLRLELSQMYSMAGDKEHGLEAVREVAQLKQRHAPGYDRVPWEKIWFQEGTIQFWYREFDPSLENMKRVAAAADEIDLNTGAYAYLRLGQIYDLTQRRANAVEAYRKTIAYAPQADAAAEARKYLSAPYRR